MDQDILLAFHEDTNANAALFRGTEIAFAVAEERINRRKFSAGYPRLSVEMILERGCVPPSGPDRVIAGNKFHILPRLFGGRMPQGEHDFFGLLQKLYLYYQAAVSRPSILARLAEAINGSLISMRLGRPVHLYDHHTAHAYSAYMTSGFDEALVVSTDNMGDGFSSKAFLGRSGRCEFLYGSTALESPGQFYGEITQLLGFHCLMAGKVTGLASFGDPRPAYPVVKSLFSLSRDGRDFATPSLITRCQRLGPFRHLMRLRPVDVAAAAQFRLEEVMLGYIEQALRETGMKRICLAGGVFGNVKLNQKILALPAVEKVWIHPGMNDQGISMGAGLQFLAEEKGLTPFPMAHCYLGPEYSADEMAQALDEARLRWVEERDMAARLAELLARKKVVARFTGRMEYGPRALGNRSILYRTDDPSVNNWLNQMLQRSEFMPFAPATLADFAETCYVDLAGAKESARFMTISFDCTEQMRRACPGVVHVDGTARPQVVAEADSPDFYRLIRLYNELTGIPSIVNTSFNMHEEPIVCTPKDALKAFLQSGIDYLALGPFLVSKADV